MKFKKTIWPGFMLVLMLAGVTPAQVTVDSDADLNRIDVVERIGETIPLDLTFVDDNGDSVRLAKYFGEKKPVVLILGYYRCPMLCNLVFNGMVDGVNELEMVPGEDYQIVTVSINPEETADLAKAKKENYLNTIEKPINDSGWMFLVGAEDQSKALAEAVGFKYFYDTARQEYAHPAAAFILTPGGTISRTLYGIDFSKTDLKLSLLEASEGHLGSPLDKLVLYCYHYNPDEGGYTVVAGNVMKLGGAATALALGVFLGLLWYGERRRRNKTAEADSRSNAASDEVRVKR